LTIIFLFLLGVGNFAMHKAVLESRHVILAQMPWLFKPLGGKFSLIIEFGLLLGSMLLADGGSIGWVWGYTIYSALNGWSAWLILSGKI
jgi:hypothetical protein